MPSPFSSYKGPTHIYALNTVIIKELDVFGVINSLDLRKFMEPGRMHPRFLKG